MLLILSTLLFMFCMWGLGRLVMRGVDSYVHQRALSYIAWHNNMELDDTGQIFDTPLPQKSVRSNYDNVIVGPWEKDEMSYKGERR